MQKLINGKFVDCSEGDLLDGDIYRIPVGKGGWQQQEFKEKQTIQSYQIQNLTVTTGGTAADFTLSGDYVADIDENIVISCELIGGGSVTYPGAIIKLPVVRHANGKPTDDEIYFNASIIDGTLTTSGSIPRSGDWKLLKSRINEALDRINANWHLDADDLGFLV